MNLSDVYRDNAEDCAFLAECAEDGDVKRALKRMEEVWRTLAQEQERLDNKRRSIKKPRL
jgi:ferric-dicitrate binding protein FerR (iron transport regulator)